MVRRNIALFAAGGALGLALVLGVYGIAAVGPAKLTGKGPAKPSPEAQGALPSPKSVPSSAAEAPPGKTLPSFDVARVEPTGDAVFAGRAEPHARVELLADGRRMAEATANRDGEWAVVLGTPLAAGDHLVTLRAKTDGKDAVSEQSLAIGIRRNQGPLVVLAEADAPSRVLQTPATADAPAAPAKAPEPASRAAGSGAGQPGSAEPRLAIGSVDYQESGRLIIAGRAESGARLRAYLNDTYVGDGISADARFTFSLGAELPPGHYRVRVDEVESQTGAVVKRVEAQFERAPSLAARGAETGAGAGQTADAALGEPQVVAIRRGDNLWNIARKQYGKGYRYTTIYEANSNQIRNPHQIYPSQIFVLPVSQTR